VCRKPLWRLYKREGSGEHKRKKDRNCPLEAVLLFTALGLLPVLLRLAAFAGNVTWILALYFSFRFLRRREPRARTVQLTKAA
jgi:hypothetical protein